MYGHPVLTGPFRGAEALAAGRLTRNELYGPRFQRLLSGVFAPAEPLCGSNPCGIPAGQPPGGVLAGYSAALLLGADRAPAHAPAEVLVPADARSARLGPISSCSGRTHIGEIDGILVCSRRIQNSVDLDV